MRIWFNHWFSTAYHLINLMRKGYGEAITVVGSGSNAKAVYRQACDEWYPEQELPDEEYATFCINFCREHDIDVFAPRRGMVVIAKHAASFEQLGTKLLLEKDGSMVALLDDKIQTYRFFAERMPDVIPNYRIIRSIAEFDQACLALQEEGTRLCYKLTVDEGAKSFRVLDDSIEDIGALYAKPGTKVTYRAARQILSNYDFKIPLMVMPYLPGADVSVDCMETDQGRLIIPRFKVGRFSEVKPDPEIIRICQEIMNILHFDMPANIQFKMNGSKPYLLEINPRMSGGLQLSCLATGINVPAIALRKCMGLGTAWQYPEPWNTRGVVNLETPMIVS